MSVQITAPELAAALDLLAVGRPDMTSQELAECLLVEAMATRLQLRRASAAHRCSNDCEHAIRAVDSRNQAWRGSAQD